MVEIGLGFCFLTLFLIYVVMTIKESKINNHKCSKIKDLKLSKKKMVENVLQWYEANHLIPQLLGVLRYY